MHENFPDETQQTRGERGRLQTMQITWLERRERETGIKWEFSRIFVE